MIAVLLAGGKGTRLGKTGQFLPKPLIHIGDEPVINSLVKKLQALPEIKTIYVLTRKEQIIEVPPFYSRQEKLDLFTAFERWKAVYYPRVEVVYEETIQTEILDGANGAIVGLCRFQKEIESRITKKLDDLPDSCIILAADNYLEDDLSVLISDAMKYPNAIINAYFDFSDKEKIRQKYGCLDVDEKGWVTEYEEKPADPSLGQTKASAAVYVFPWEQFKKLETYAKSPKYGMDAPGSLLKWFITDVYPYNKISSEHQRTQGIGVRGYHLKGEWFDIGRKSDLIAAIKHYVNNFLMEMTTVEDLLLAERTDGLTDKCFLLCHRISVHPDKGVIRLVFRGEDQICKLSDGILGNIPTVGNVKAASQQADYWPKLIQSVVQREGGFVAIDEPLKEPLLVSGGVFLLDSVGGRITDGGTRLPRSRTLLPLLEKDPASPTDPGRLTTPAGRLDRLDLRQVCYGELCEEMIFYGAKQGFDAPRILVIAPIELRDVKRRVLRRILEKNVTIPGIDRERIAVQSRLAEKDISMVDIIPPLDILLPKDRAWTIEIYLDGYRQSVCENVIVIPDRDNGTLEFRVACFADITGTPNGERPICNKFSKQVGGLLGIADGDGFSRRPFIISAQSFARYYTKMNMCQKEDILQYLMDSQHDAIDIVATGSPGTGRFENFDCQMPVLPLTTSVRHLAELLECLF